MILESLKVIWYFLRITTRGITMDIGVKKKKSKNEGLTDRSITGTESQQLKLDDAAVQKIIDDVLGSGQGLASIFGGEQTAGIFDSSVAAQSAGDLAANIVGELAKLTGESVTTKDLKERAITTDTSKTTSAGLSL